MDLCGDAQESGMIFVAVIHARDHADADDAMTFRQSSRRFGERLVGQGVSDDCDLPGREANGQESIGGSLGVADNGIAAAKCNGLGAELRGRHQVSKLAMAADDDGHAGELSGGNQRQIGVEIERVGNVHAMLAKMAPEVEARAQGLPSVEAASEGKFRSVGKVISERAAAADAAEMSLELRRREILGEDGELALGTSRFKSIDHQKNTDCLIDDGLSGAWLSGKIGWRNRVWADWHSIILPPERRLARWNWARGGGSRRPRGAKRGQRA